MRILPRWLAKFPILPRYVFQPVITLRQEDKYWTRRYGLMPDGSEIRLERTIRQNLDEAKREYTRMLARNGVEWVFPVKVVGTDWEPMPEPMPGELRLRDRL